MINTYKLRNSSFYNYRLTITSFSLVSRLFVCILRPLRSEKLYPDLPGLNKSTALIFAGISLEEKK